MESCGDSARILKEGLPPKPLRDTLTIGISEKKKSLNNPNRFETIGKSGMETEKASQGRKLTTSVSHSRSRALPALYFERSSMNKKKEIQQLLWLIRHGLISLKDAQKKQAKILRKRT